MRPFFSNWPRIARRMEAAKQSIFLFDLDGTLAPFAPTPAQARLPAGTRSRLAELDKRFPGRVGVISGRSLDDTRKKTGLPKLMYGGNHGLEIETKRWRYEHPQARRHRALIAEVFRNILAGFRGVKGLVFQNKRYSISVHYRNVPAGRVPAIKLRFRQMIAPFVKRGQVRVTKGKKVIEIRSPIDWDKGTAARLMQKRQAPRGVIFFAGDDDTDEDVFRQLGKKDIGARVGRKKGSKADFYISKQNDIDAMLGRLCSL